MNKNVSIVVVILVLVVIAGYLVWLRSKVSPVISPNIEEQVQLTPTPIASVIQTSSPSATPGIKEATGSTKTATPSAKPKVSPRVSARVSPSGN